MPDVTSAICGASDQVVIAPAGPMQMRRRLEQEDCCEPRLAGADGGDLICPLERLVVCRRFRYSQSTHRSDLPYLRTAGFANGKVAPPDGGPFWLSEVVKQERRVVAVMREKRNWE